MNARRDKVDITLESSHQEDVRHVVNHNIGTTHLLKGALIYASVGWVKNAPYLPRLDTHSRQRSLPHAIGDELPPATRRFALRDEHGVDFFPLGNNQRIILVATSLNIGQGLDGFFLTANLSQPSRRPREERQANHEADTRDKLRPPGCPEGGSTLDLGAAITNEVHDEDTPLDSKLLNDYNILSQQFFFMNILATKEARHIETAY